MYGATPYVPWNALWVGAEWVLIGGGGGDLVAEWVLIAPSFAVIAILLDGPAGL